MCLQHFSAPVLLNIFLRHCTERGRENCEGGRENGRNGKEGEKEGEKEGGIGVRKAHVMELHWTFKL